MRGPRRSWSCDEHRRAAPRLRRSVAGAARRVPELDRFAEALRARVMGPRLADALGGSDEHVSRPRRQVRARRPGDGALRVRRPAASAATSSRTARSRTSATGDGGVVVAPGSGSPSSRDDPDLPSLPRVVDPARLGPVLADALSRTTPDTSRRGARCRTTLLRYRPGKRVTLRVTFVGRHGRLRGQGLPRPAQGGCRRRGGSRPGRSRRRVRHAPHPGDGGASSASTAWWSSGLCRACPSRRSLGRSLSSPGGVRIATDAMSRAGRALAELHAHAAGDRARPVGRRRGRPLRRARGRRRGRRPAAR